MKRFSAMGLFFMLLFVWEGLTSRALAQFEGVLESRNVTVDENGERQEFTMTIWIKGDMVKIKTTPAGEIPGSTMISRRDRGVTWILDDDAKTYFVIAHDQGRREVSPLHADDQTYKIERTGKTRSILGYPCEFFVIRHEDQETQLWGTTRLKHLVNAMAKSLGQDHLDAGEGWAEELRKLGVFPLISTTMISGKVVESQEITKLAAQNLPLKLFELPAGYKKQKIGDVIKE